MSQSMHNSFTHSPSTNLEDEEKEELGDLASKLQYMDLEELGDGELERFFVLAEKRYVSPEEEPHLAPETLIPNLGFPLPVSIDSKIVVSSPMGILYRFDRGATVLDFAYQLHTELGHECIGAIIDGKYEVEPGTRLRDGVQVEIRTGLVEPDPSWLNLVNTSKAQRSIKRYLQFQENWSEGAWDTRSPNILPNRCVPRRSRRSHLSSAPSNSELSSSSPEGRRCCFTEATPQLSVG